MKQATRTWVDKAEGDLLLVQQTLATASPVYDGACFHAQQCAEKYLKALLQENAIQYPRTHDLTDLYQLSGSLIPGLAAHAQDLAWLTTFAVDIRYPGVSASQQEAQDALRIATDVRTHIRSALGLPAPPSAPTP